MSQNNQSHARRNPLTGEWVLVSPHRTLRPWQGQIEPPEIVPTGSYVADCYLCPGNQRANGNHNPDYRGPFAFDNDFSALSGDPPHSVGTNESSALFEARSEAGRCRVVCYSEQHDKTLATLPIGDVVAAVRAIIDEFEALDTSGDYGYVQFFENRGLMMGCSNPHPHAQVWATENIPNEAAKELAAQSKYYRDYGSVLLLDYLQAELDDGVRVVVENEHFVTVVPYWAIWPFETMILPRAARTSPAELSSAEVYSLADSLKSVLAIYDQLFDAPASYSLGFHARPCGGDSHPGWQFHAHLLPPMLRSASVRKHLVGFELLGMPQRDLTPEVAAEQLRVIATRRSKDRD